MAEEKEKKNVYITLHKNFVREGIEYNDRATGESKAFNQVTLPRGLVIDGKDIGGYEFSPLYVNESRFRGPDWRDIPLLADREVWLQKSILDEEGNYAFGEDGRRMKDTVKVMPQQLKDAITESRKAYAAEHQETLADKAKEVRSCADALDRSQHAVPSQDAR